MDKDIMLVFGPVLDLLKGMYGLGIIAVDSEAQMKELIAHDPASKINEYEFYPMMAVTPQRLGM